MNYRFEPRKNSARGAGIRIAGLTASRIYKALGLGVLITLVAGSFAACSQGAEEEPPRGVGAPVGGGGGEAGTGGTGGSGGSAGTANGGSGGGSAAVCVDGAKKECSVFIGENNGVKTCFKGVQICLGGVWGPCDEGTIPFAPQPQGDPSEKPIGTANGLTNCVTNPCDPSCQMFDEDPDGGLNTNSQTPVFSWETGDLGNYPSTVTSKGVKEPCSTGSDCQFNQYCSAPVSGTCEHSKCAFGEAMTNGCDTCVNEICAIDANCCTNPYTGGCAHDYCDQGVPLANGCNACVNSICAEDFTCCAHTYGTCSHDFCDQGTSLANGCSSCVSSVCAKDPRCCADTTPGTCPHDYCATGAAMANGCHSCVTDICAVEPECCKTHTTGSCAHDYCATGTALNSNCHTCATEVCAADPKCCNLNTTGTCAHGYCSTGAALAAGCHSCIDDICAVDPKCCVRPTGTCSHDFCATGSALANNCHSCVSTVCADDPKCCGLNTQGTCSHDYCATSGAALAPGCHSCVDDICAVDPKCCDSTIGTTTCAHDYCSTGAKLAASCDPCVATVCAANSNCCNGSGNAWSNTCINLVNSLCQTNDRCPSPKWSSSCQAKVSSVCGNTCTASWGSTCTAKAAACSGDNCATHSWTSSCVNKVSSVCGNTCTASWGSTCVDKATQCAAANGCNTWDQSCVDKVASVCGNTCSSSWGPTCRAKVNTLCDSTECVPRDWDQDCVNKVATTCGKTCGPFEWDNDCVDMVDTVCAATCYDDPGCSHDKCDSGGPLNASCDSCVASICQELPFCCTTEWTDLCVDRVKTRCNTGCPTRGDCIPWLPGQSDPECAGYDLALGIPCGNSIPVCNHGKTTVPEGVKIVHFPSSAAQFPKCTPNQANPQMRSCSTTAPIPPGQCINLPVASCNIAGTDPREIMVNPPTYGGYTQLPECTCRDNWSLWPGSNTACKAPSCSNTTTTTVRRVNMFITMDRSGSMDTSLGNGDTRWTATIKALKAFVRDPASANLGIALRFWPDDDPVSGCNGSSCSQSACKTPLVPVGLLTLQSAPTDTQEQLLITKLSSKSPSGNTPLSAALDGATKWAIEYKAAHPQEEAFAVIATDGEPTACTTTDSGIVNIAANAFNNYGIKTYAIGIEEANPDLMNQIAAVGGTRSAYLIAAGSNVEYELLAALVQIKGNTVSCDFEVPQDGVYDPSAAKITLTATNGTAVLLANRGSLAQCGTGAGWYYDNPAAPTLIKLCPSSCTTVLNDSGTKISVDLGCPGNYSPVTYTYQYYSDCPQGTKTQWTYMSYDTQTPGNSNVVFQARTANTIPLLANATYTTLATAKASPNTQVCRMSGPAPCPLDLYNAFGSVDARKSFLELSMTLNPSLDRSGGATVLGWEVMYSCPPSE